MPRGARLPMVALCAGTLLAGSLALAGEPANLLSNGGFEEGMMGWHADPARALATDPALAIGGDRGLIAFEADPNAASWTSPVWFGAE